MSNSRFQQTINGYKITFSTIYQVYRIHRGGKLVGSTADKQVAIAACKAANKKAS